jgi:hypothetical protein
MSGAEGQTSVRADVEAAIAKLSTPAPDAGTNDVDVNVAGPGADENVDTSLPEETPTERADRERDEAGRFAKKKAEKPAEPDPDATDPGLPPVDPNAPVVVQTKAPASLKPGIKAKWAEIPEDVRQEFIRLESTQQKGMQKVAEDANFGRALRDVVSPHEATFRAMGVNAPQAVDALLRADYKLRTAHPVEKAQYLMQLAKSYGADMSAFQAPVDGQNPQQSPQLDPATSAMWSELQALKQASQQQQTERERYEANKAQSEIEAFANDPANEFFEDVRGDMAILINSGRAKTLPEAYEMAKYANPEVRQAVLEREFADREAKRRAEQAKAVDAKKAAGVSVRGSGPANVTAAPKDESVRDTITRVMSGAGRI